MKKKILIVFGTRPEAIKLAPVIKELKKNEMIETLVCVFRQHKELLDQVLKTFNLKPDFDLSISLSDKELFGGEVGFIKKIKTLIESGLGFLKFFYLLKKKRPDLMVVQGDTLTAFLAAFLAYLFKIPIAHIEAGLRTYDKYAPFPEEMNRQLISRLADLHFAPTEQAKNNLLAEGVPAQKIYLVGNTEIDALLLISQFFKDPLVVEEMEKNLAKNYGLKLDERKKIILVTAHRRESFGSGLENICQALKEIASKRDDVIIIYPIHPNPNVEKTVKRILSGTKNIFLIPALAYKSFVFLMSKSYLILTDSGGIQELAPSLNKPVLVMREKTERVEGIEIGASKLVGTDKEKIIKSAFELLDNQGLYASMINKKNPYGDGTASIKIAQVINEFLK